MREKLKELMRWAEIYKPKLLLGSERYGVSSRLGHGKTGIVDLTATRRDREEMGEFAGWPK